MSKLKKILVVAFFLLCFFCVPRDIFAKEVINSSIIRINDFSGPIYNEHCNYISLQDDRYTVKQSWKINSNVMKDSDVFQKNQLYVYNLELIPKEDFYFDNNSIINTDVFRNVSSFKNDSTSITDEGHLVYFAEYLITDDSVSSSKSSSIPLLNYQSHIQTYGWEAMRHDGEMSGTSGLAKRLEAIKISLNGNSVSGGIEYITYCQTYGWLDWVSNGEISGTSGQSKRLEAIKIRLTGEIASEYDIYYRVHVQSYGWLGWAKNGETAGTLDLAKRMEALEIKLVPKGTGEETGSSSVYLRDVLKYQTHIQSIGWQKAVSNGVSGTVGKSLRIEGLKVDVTDIELPGNVEYCSYVEGKGWESSWKSNNQLSGTSGQSKRLTAIKLRLTKDLSEVYDIYYRTHVQGFGWLGWAKNGEISGNVGYDMRIEAIEIKLVPKGTGEETGASYVEKDAYLNYSAHVQSIGDQSPVFEGGVSGTVGLSKRMEGLSISLDTGLAGKVMYQSYVYRNGWESEWQETGGFTGTKNQGKAIQLIKIKLDGEISEKYDIYYRVHSSKFGWLGWAKNGEIAGVKAYDIQAIQIKLYLKIDSSKNQLNTYNHYIDKVYYVPVYYSQKDSRWANTMYGAGSMKTTGCAPTSMAMAYSSILGRTVLPVDVANYLYYNTNEYNRYQLGSSGLAIIYASDHFGVQCTPIKNINDMAKALRDGKILFAAMGNGKFATTSWNHAIVLYSYNNGYVIAYDPINSSKNGWVSLSQVWSEQSRDPDDSKGGSNFYSLGRFY